MIVRPSDPQKLISRLKGQPLVLYGFGGAGSRIGQWCDENGIDYIFADRQAEQKQKETDRLVIPPARLAKDYPNANIVISSMIYYDEIKENLLSMGIPEGNLLSCQLFFPERVTWRELEHSTEWGTHMGRVKLIADWIPEDASSVADYGAGKLSLREFLEPAVLYRPIDYVKRSEDTVVCDFDRDSFPELSADISVCTATLVFLERAEKLLEHICIHTAQSIILSYVTREKFPNIAGRRASGYVNDFTHDDIQKLLLRHGFTLVETRPDPANQIDTLYLFRRGSGRSAL